MILIVILALAIIMLYQMGRYEPPRDNLRVGSRGRGLDGWNWIPEANCYDYANSKCINEPMMQRERCVYKLYHGCLEDAS
jgi:hypothetical protein